MSEPIITFDKVVKSFGDHVVLNELDFTVAPGEKVTIIGPSGSGKSTVLRILMTLEKINGGVITVGGEPLWHERKNGKLVPASEAHLRNMRKHARHGLPAVQPVPAHDGDAQHHRSADRGARAVQGRRRASAPSSCWRWSG